MGRGRHPRTRGVALAIAVAGMLAAAPGPAGAATTCDRVASPTGSDSAAGTAAAPYRTTQKLVDSLSAGQTGCFRAGTYSFTSVKLTHGGTPAAPIQVTSYPGERAKLVGRLWVDVGANDVTFSNLDFDGTNPDGLPSPLILGNDVTFTDDDVTDNHTGICFIVGAEGWEWAVAQRTVITRNRIHHCGRLPATNHDHGIYLENTTDAQVTYNLIYQNADRGIQLYPNAQRTTISHNVIDRDGEGILFSGADGYASSDTVVNANIITNAVLRADVESWYPSGNPVGGNNQVTGNCIFGGRATIDTSNGGFTASGNTFQDPQFIDGANGDYHLRGTSPCLAVAGDTAALLDGTPVDAAPDAVTVLDGTRLSGNAASLAADDGDTYQVASDPVSQTASWYGSFNRVTNSLRGLTVHYIGSAFLGCSQTISVYRFTDGTWVTLDSRSVDRSGADVAGLAPTGTLADYVSGASGDGELRVRVACTSAVPFVGSGELLRIQFVRP